MKHVKPVSNTPGLAALSPLQVKLQGITDILDQLLLAQRQVAWKAWFPPGGSNNTTTGNTTTTGAL